jgi:hypothetical protein
MVGLLILLLLDPGQHLAETLVLDDGRVADALQLVEGRVRQRQSLPAYLQPAIGKVIDVDQLADALAYPKLLSEPNFSSLVENGQVNPDRIPGTPSDESWLSKT